MNRLVGVAAVGLLAALLIGGACEEGGPGSGPGGSGAGGCPTAPLFVLHVTARTGSLPSDTHLRVTWSAGEEPEFALDDPATWLTLDDDTLVECDVERDASVPVELDELVCELWTGGTTEVVVTAAGYLTVEQTFTPAEREGCDSFVTSDVSVELTRDPDAGAD